MTKTFKDISSFKKHIEKNFVLRSTSATEAALKAGAGYLQKKAKDQFGKYPVEISFFDQPFRASHHHGLWDELAPSTKDDRVRQGFPANEPLLRTGKLRDSIKLSVKLNNAVVGSDEDIMVWQELGTEKIPPRPVLGLTAHRHGKDASRLIGAVYVSKMFGATPFGSRTEIKEGDIINAND